MKTHIVLEGPSDRAFVQRILKYAGLQDQVVLQMAGGVNQARPWARRVQLDTGAPVLLLLNADTTNLERAAQERCDLQTYLHMSSLGAPSEVILFVPALEIVLFGADGPIRRLVGQEIPAAFTALAQDAPKKALQILLSDGPDPVALFQQLTDDEVQHICQHPEVAAILRFVVEAAQHTADADRRQTPAA